ncbi:MAG: MaoC family dehydratase [bacterium]
MIEKLKVGDKAQLKKVFTEEDLEKFSQICTDRNPLHFDDDYAQSTLFGKRILPGMLTASLFSGLVGNHIPGTGGIYLGQTLNFRKPVYIGEEVTATAEIVAIREDKPIITMRMLCTNSGGEICVEGEAVVKYTSVAG